MELNWILSAAVCVSMVISCLGQQQSNTLRSSWSNFLRNEAMGIDTPDYIKDRLRLQALDMLGLGGPLGGSLSRTSTGNTFGGAQTIDQGMLNLGGTRSRGSSSIIIQSSSNHNTARQPSSLNSRLRRRRLIDLLFDKL